MTAATARKLSAVAPSSSVSLFVPEAKQVTAKLKIVIDDETKMRAEFEAKLLAMRGAKMTDAVKDAFRACDALEVSATTENIRDLVLLSTCKPGTLPVKTFDDDVIAALESLCEPRREGKGRKGAWSLKASAIA